MTDNKDARHSNKEEPVKAAYHSPQFSIYGDIRELTQSNTNSMNMSDMAGGPFKT